MIPGTGRAGETGNEHAAAPHEKHWGYEDGPETVGPDKWGTLPGDETCSTGKEETPIDIRLSGPDAAKARDLPDLVFKYLPSKLSMSNNGHTVTMTYDAGSTLGRVGSDSKLTLAQFHFHAPSENRLDGKSFPMELHLVHLDASGKPAAVVAVFIQAGKANAALAKAFASLPAAAGDKNEPRGETIDAIGLLPAGDRTFITFPGSLTTPPCSEGITWYVMKTPITLSQEQIDAYTRLEHLGHTNRPLQKLGARTPLIDSTPARH